MIDMPLDDRVLTALENNPYVPRRNLRFETAEGRVTLRGVVDSYFQKQMAQEALRHVDGIDQISNELEVCWGRPAAVPIAHVAQASSL
jgi:osmotically-inducible protein OsmY